MTNANHYKHQDAHFLKTDNTGSASNTAGFKVRYFACTALVSALSSSDIIKSSGIRKGSENSSTATLLILAHRTTLLAHAHAQFRFRSSHAIRGAHSQFPVSANSDPLLYFHSLTRCCPKRNWALLRALSLELCYFWHFAIRFARDFAAPICLHRDDVKLLGFIR